MKRKQSREPEAPRSRNVTQRGHQGRTNCIRKACRGVALVSAVVNSQRGGRKEKTRKLAMSEARRSHENGL